MMNNGNLFADYYQVATGQVKIEDNWDVFMLTKASDLPSKW